MFDSDISIFFVKNIWLSNVSCNQILFFWSSNFEMRIVVCEVWKSTPRIPKTSHSRIGIVPPVTLDLVVWIIEAQAEEAFQS